jgi:hypothetical protein
VPRNIRTLSDKLGGGGGDGKARVFIFFLFFCFLFFTFSPLRVILTIIKLLMFESGRKS